MSAIPSNLSSLTQSLLSLSAQTQAASVRRDADSDGDNSASSAVPASADTVTLSSAASSPDASSAAAQVALQNQLAALADPAQALGVNQAAIAFLGAQPDTALGAQANLSASFALNL